MSDFFIVTTVELLSQLQPSLWVLLNIQLGLGFLVFRFFCYPMVFNNFIRRYNGFEILFFLNLCFFTHDALFFMFMISVLDLCNNYLLRD